MKRTIGLTPAIGCPGLLPWALPLALLFGALAAGCGGDDGYDPEAASRGKADTADEQHVRPCTDDEMQTCRAAAESHGMPCVSCDVVWTRSVERNGVVYARGDDSAAPASTGRPWVKCSLDNWSCEPARAAIADDGEQGDR